MNLQNWVNQAREHWKEFQPNRYSALVQSGKLEAALQDAAERTYREMTELEDQGYDYQDAWEIVRERYLFVPEEGKNPTAYSESYFNRSTLTTRITVGKTVAGVNSEVPRTIQRERDEPKINMFSAGYVDPVQQRNANELAGLKSIGGALLASIIIGLLWFILFGV